MLNFNQVSLVYQVVFTCTAVTLQLASFLHVT